MPGCCCLRADVFQLFNSLSKHIDMLPAAGYDKIYIAFISRDPALHMTHLVISVTLHQPVAVTSGEAKFASVEPVAGP